MEIIDLKEKPDLIPLLAKWHHDQWAFLNPDSTLETRIAKYQEYLGEAIVPGSFVAVEGDIVLGSAAIIENDMETRMEYTPWLASVYVRPDHRNKRIGSYLVKHIMTTARQAAFNKLYLFTPDKESFYKRIGWSTIHNESYHDTSVTVMSVKFGT